MKENLLLTNADATWTVFLYQDRYSSFYWGEKSWKNDHITIFKCLMLVSTVIRFYNFRNFSSEKLY